MAIKRVCTMVRDGTHLPPQRVEIGVPLLSVRNIQKSLFSFLDDDSCISETDYETLCRSFVPASGDVLLAIVGATLGKAAVVPAEMGRFQIQRSLGIFRASSVLESEWLHQVFLSSGFQSNLWNNVGFSAQPGIYLGALANFQIPVPPKSEQAKILRVIVPRKRAFDEMIGHCEAAIALLNERRAAVITAAVTGKIDVRGLRPAEQNRETA